MKNNAKNELKNAVLALHNDDAKSLKTSINKALLIKVRDAIESKRKEYAKKIFKDTII